MIKRKIRASYANTKVGRTVTVIIALLPNGDEDAASFSIRFDAGKLRYKSLTLAPNTPQGITVGANTDRLKDGLLGVNFDSTQPFAKSDSLLHLLHIRFDALAVGISPITFVEKPTPKSLATGAVLVYPDYVGGSVGITK